MLLYFLACLILAIIFGGAYYAYRITFYSPTKNRDQLPVTDSPHYDLYRDEMKRMFHQLQNMPCEYVTVLSHDGLTLSGRYYHIRDGAPLAIGFHGYRSSPMTDFSGGSELSFRMGHNLLLVDQRAHGKSQGRTITFGIQERRDCLTWVNYALNRFENDTKILLYGISMGGATVLMASEQDLPRNVKGIIADCPYASPKEIICAVGVTRGFPTWLMWPFVKIGARVYGGFDIEEIDASKAVSKATVPILIIHGENDHLVPMEMSNLIAQNPNLITRVTFPGADHGLSYLVDKKQYEQVVTEFVNSILNI